MSFLGKLKFLFDPEQHALQLPGEQGWPRISGGDQGPPSLRQPLVVAKVVSKTKGFLLGLAKKNDPTPVPSRRPTTTQDRPYNTTEGNRLNEPRPALCDAPENPCPEAKNPKIVVHFFLKKETNLSRAQHKSMEWMRLEVGPIAQLLESLTKNNQRNPRPRCTA